MSGDADTPRSASDSSLISFFLAAMIPLSDAYRCVSSHSASAAASPSARTAFLPMMRRSTVTTAGSRTRFSSTPASTSRVTVALLPSAARRMLARKVACGQPSSPARICPTWFESPSTACFPSTTRSGFSRSTTALTTRATAQASSAASSPPMRIARSAPIASTPRNCCPTSFGPMLSATTSPDRAPPLPASVRRSAVSTAYSSNVLSCQLAEARSILPPPNLSLCSGFGTRLHVTRIFTAVTLTIDSTHRQPESFFQAKQDLVVDVDQIDRCRLRLPVRAQLVDHRPRRVRRVHAAQARSHTGDGQHVDPETGRRQQRRARRAPDVLDADLHPRLLHRRRVNDLLREQLAGIGHDGGADGDRRQRHRLL